MTLHRLPDPVPASASVEDRLDNIDARIDVLIDGIKEILSEVTALRQRMEATR
ncbi:hypothetical protein [Blastococcus sp. TF02A-30]|uniref:hypothetical protein n=1 Tax=Blastococcus sp. TF02A-30 TaxID=2250580 RepID=UPI0013146851|nr:hypothetical protein [Blastococcus sp. TF02A-30]